MKSSALCTEEEGINEFNARMDREDMESFAVVCPVKSCRAQVGDKCRTENGIVRIRHAQRLWLARREKQ
jgi:hypothetical protein